jgi:hypothetical protein
VFSNLGGLAVLGITRPAAASPFTDVEVQAGGNPIRLNG